jgi:anti-sigma B factor antagonist
MTTQPPPHLSGDTVDDRGGLTIDVLGADPCTRVLVGGELDCRTAPRLVRCVYGLLDSGHRQIDMDLSGVTFVGAAGLTAFREAAFRAGQVGGRARLAAVPAQVRRILAITALDTVVEVQPPDGCVASAFAARSTPA